MGNSSKKQGNIVAILAMVFLFAMIAFVTNLCSPMAVILKNAFKVPETLAQVGNYGNFGAYLLMGVPAGLLIDKFGYKKTALAALVVGIVGLLIQWVSGSMGFVVYLIGAFISGLCMCMLNTVVNPMLNLLGGGGKTGNQLVQIGGVFNSAAAVCVYMLMGSLIGDAATAKVSDAAPALFIALAIFVFALVVISFTKIQEPQSGGNNSAVAQDKYSCYSFRHFKLGMLAIAVYGAVEVGPPTYILSYLTSAPDAANPGLGMDAGYCGTLGAVYFIFMLIGRFVGGVVGGKISPKAMISTVSLVSIILVAAGMMLPVTQTISCPGINYTTMSFVWGKIPVGVFAFLLVGLCASVMWGGIFNLATEGLGKYTAKASGAFMMMVAGFAVMIAIQAWVVDLTHSYITSFIVVLLSAAYIFYYAMWGSKNVNTDIPVE
jgi:MFS transporter, FHS family, L-fucose permease